MDKVEQLRQQAQQSMDRGMLLAFIAVVIASLPLLLAALHAFRGKLKLTKGTPITGTEATLFGLTFIVAFVAIVGFAALKTILSE